MTYYLGLDNGGTTTKASLFDERGREVATVSVDTQMITPQPGFTERDMEEMWDANCTCIRGVIEKSAVDPDTIACVAVCGHGKGLYLWGKDGKPVRNGIISTDNRAWEYPRKWQCDGTEDRVFSLSCQHIMACQPVALLAWLQDREPECIDKIQWIFECKDYVRFRLTGKAYGELSDYSGANFVDLHTGAYNRELLDCFGLGWCLEHLPPLVQATDLCGTITEETAARTGLKAGTPVAGGAFDIDACAVAVNVTDEDHICMIAGTWSINEYLGLSPVTNGSVLMNSYFCVKPYYLVEECSPTSAGNNAWFINTFLQDVKAQGNLYETLNRWVNEIPPEEFCPVFLPYLLASNVHPNAKGSFVGLSNYHTRAHMARSVYEGIAFSHRYHLDKLLKNKETPARSIRLAGGMANSAVWVQMLADITGLPIEVVEAKETGNLGCAILGAVATGAYPDITEAAAAMCSIAPAILPNPKKKAIYDRKYQMFLRVIEALDGVWDEMQCLIDRREED